MRNPIRDFNRTPEEIRRAGRMYIRYAVALRQGEEMGCESGSDVGHEKGRGWWNGGGAGGAAGAAAPLIADAAANGHIGAPGLLLFAIVFSWQPPHVWAIALYRKADYAAAGIPMLPHVIGDERTRRHMLAYTIGLVPVTLAPVFMGILDP